MSESAHQFDRQVEARRYVEACVSRFILTELQLYDGTVEGWFMGDVTHEPTRRRITKAAKALAARLQRASQR